MVSDNFYLGAFGSLATGGVAGVGALLVANGQALGALLIALAVYLFSMSLNAMHYRLKLLLDRK
jgi:hypothetical protein